MGKESNLPDAEMIPIENDQKGDTTFSNTITNFFQNLNQRGKQPMRLKTYVVFILFALIFILTLCLIIVASVGLNNTSAQSNLPTISPSVKPSTTTLTTTDPNGDGPWQNSELNNDTIPYSYDIQFSIYPKKGNSIVFETGATILIKNNLDQNEYIILHKDPSLYILDPNVFLLNSLSDPDGTKINLGRVFTTVQYEYLVIQLKEKLPKDSIIRLDFYAEGFISSNQRGGVFKYETM